MLSMCGGMQPDGSLQLGSARVGSAFGEIFSQRVSAGLRRNRDRAAGSAKWMVSVDMICSFRVVHVAFWVRLGVGRSVNFVLDSRATTEGVSADPAHNPNFSSARGRYLFG